MNRAARDIGRPRRACCLLVLAACSGGGGGDGQETSETGTETTTDTGEETDTTESTGSTDDGTQGTDSTETTGCMPGTLGCTCSDGDPPCEEGVCDAGTCVPDPVCGNTMPELGEDCDDGNAVDNDGCNADCSASSVETWRQTWDSGEGDDEARDAFVDADGNVYVTGTRATSGQGTDLLVLKFDLDGMLQWAVDWDGAGSGNDTGMGIVADASDVHVVGTSASGGQNGDALVLRRLSAADGSETWIEIVQGTKVLGNDAGGDVALDSEGNVYVAGTLEQDGSNKDIMVARYDDAGDPVWTTLFTGDQDQTDLGLSIALDPADNVLATGRVFATGEGQNVFVAKLGSNLGNELWRRSTHVGTVDAGFGIGAGDDGHIVVSGAAGVGGQLGDEAWLREHTPAGDEDWTATSGVADDDEGRRVAVAADGSSIQVGFLPGDGGTDGVARRRDGDGTLVWTHTFVGAQGGDDDAWGVALGPEGDVAVAGTETGATDRDIFVVVLEP